MSTGWRTCFKVWFLGSCRTKKEDDANIPTLHELPLPGINEAGVIFSHTGRNAAKEKPLAEKRLQIHYNYKKPTSDTDGAPFTFRDGFLAHNL